MSRARSLLGLAVGVGMLALPAAPTAIAGGTYAGGAAATTGCMPQTYQGKYVVKTYNRAPVLAHVSHIVIGPSGSHTVSKEAAFERKITASAELNTGVSIGASTVYAEVEGHYDVTVRSEGSHTESGKVTVTDVVSNPTKRNKVFIAFDGVTRYFGKYYLKSCGWDHQVHRSHGHYVTFNDYTEGIPRCGAGDGGSNIVHLALKRCSL